MALPDSHSPQLLADEILAEARRESDQILGRARLEAAAILAKAETEVAQLKQQRLDQARAEAARQTDSILATVPVEANRLRLAQVETLLQSLHDEASRRLHAREGFDYGQTLGLLAAEALERISDTQSIVKLSPGDRAAFGAELAKELAVGLGATRSHPVIAEDPTINEDGVIVQDSAGHQVWDNRLAARLERLWPEMRRQLAVQAGLAEANRPAGGLL